MARAAGMRVTSAATVATASEYVDDAIWDKEFFFEDGRSILSEITAHKMLDLKNADGEDQRKVWLPFHFLPGGTGETITDRLICTKNSCIAKSMVRQNTAVAADLSYGLQLMGITAHVYADTFAHYGFMGANHEYNAIKAGSIEIKISNSDIFSYIENKAKSLWKEALSYGLSQTLPLGHGAAATYPDRPYLNWSYVRAEDEKTIERENSKDFLEACKALHGMFERYLEKVPQKGETGTAKKWKDIREPLKQIIAIEGDKKERIKAWKGAIKDNRLFGGNTKIPEYKGHKWSASIDDIEPKKIPKHIDKLPVYRFYQAARIHRAQVLSNLLPNERIIAA